MAATRTLSQSEAPTLTTDSRPVPDPTSLTTQQLQAAISALRDTINVRFEGVEKATDLLQAAANRSPTIAEVWSRHDEKFVGINQSIKAEREISNKMFLGVDQQFVQIEKAATQLKIASDTAVAAALQAQKEAAGEAQKSSAAAIAKAESATSKSIEQLQQLFQTSIAGLSKEVADLKSRFDRGEGAGTGNRLSIDDYRFERTDSRAAVADQRGSLYGIIGIGIASSAVIVAIFGHLLH
jgi:hypothetical protein